MYYQVLMDTRDVQDVSPKMLKDGVTFLPDVNNIDSTLLHVMPAMDYVTQDDVIPYSSSEVLPIQHDYFHEFLESVPESIDDDVPARALRPTATLLSWLQDRRPALAMSSVYRQTTETVRVTVAPFYMGCRRAPLNAQAAPRPRAGAASVSEEGGSTHFWRYLVRLESRDGAPPVQLRERYWKMYSVPGSIETVKGQGVLGQQPVLSGSAPTFQYYSHVLLQAPEGHMWGSFRFERAADGTSFDVKIPPFELLSRAECDW